MAYSTVQEYNDYLIESKLQVDIIEYVKTINKIKYNIDISFIDEFIELVSKDECCIHHDLLQKYGIISLNKGSTDIKRLLDQNEFTENDYKLRNVAEFNKGGRGNKIEYYLHPRAFKLCLMRSLKKKKYANYYLLLEECITYYKTYQDTLKDKYIVKLKDKLYDKKIIIKEQNTKIDEILTRSKKMEAQLNEALEKLELTNDKLDDTKEELEEAHEKIDTTNNTLNVVAKKLDVAVEDRVVKPKQKSILEYLVIMKNPTATYKYYIIRGQKRYITKKKNGLVGYTEIKSFECVPNANILWNNIKENMRNNDFMGNKINLNNMEENVFINQIEFIYNERKNVVI
jgi:exonuclease VII small subunit